MSKSEHTPGPWLVQETTVYALNDERNPANRFTASVDSGWADEKCRISRQEVEANARLIAAAPDLLESLTNLVGLAKLGAARLDKYQAAMSAAEAAIAKAEGKS